MTACRYAFAFVLVALFLHATPSWAADITVNRECTLADAIEAANSDEAVGGCPAGDGADTIALSADVTLDQMLPAVNSTVILEGKGFTISGGFQFQIFVIEKGELWLNEVTLSNGYAGWGGAISNEGLVRISNSVFNGNYADYQGGAVYSEGELQVRDSTFDRNYAGYGGAVQISGVGLIDSVDFTNNEAQFGGGAIDIGLVDTSTAVYPEVAILNSRFSGNIAGWGGALLAEGALSITGSAFSRNEADDGGAFYGWGILDANIRNTTFAHNQALDEGGAIYADSTYGDEDTLTFTFATIAHNSAARGSSIFVTSEPAASVIVQSSILATDDEHNCYGDVVTRSSNLASDATCGASQVADPQLGELVEPQDGSPPYIPLMPGSPAIDAAVGEFCPDTDQIGTPRPQGEACDIGAVEYVQEK